MSVAEEILRQLGGNRFKAMTGANVYSDNGGNSLIVKFKGSPKANYMRIDYKAGKDLYDVKISKLRTGELKTIFEADGIYCDQLTEIFERETGLYTSL
jgi:hypothetical protein